MNSSKTNLSAVPANSITRKIRTLEEAVLWRNELKEKGMRLAVTNGCFDILHRGHAEYLLAARSQADALLVLVNSDESVRALKGPTRPVNKEYDREFLLASLECVDCCLIFCGQRCDAELAALQPDVYVKGGDYTVEKLDPGERDALIKAGSDFCFIPFVDGYSTTGVIRKISGEKR